MDGMADSDVAMPDSPLSVAMELSDIDPAQLGGGPPAAQ